jgi:hypothetical protein
MARKSNGNKGPKMGTSTSAYGAATDGVLGKMVKNFDSAMDKNKRGKGKL